MKPLATAMLAIFLAAWCVGVAAWFYAMRFFLPMWLAGFRHRDEHVGYPRKTLIGTGVFLAAIAVGVAAGLVAEFWAGGWDS